MKKTNLKIFDIEVWEDEYCPKDCIYLINKKTLDKIKDDINKLPLYRTDKGPSDFPYVKGPGDTL